MKIGQSCTSHNCDHAGNLTSLQICYIRSGTHFTSSFIFKTYSVKKCILILPHSSVLFCLVMYTSVIVEAKHYWSMFVNRSEKVTFAFLLQYCHSLVNDAFLFSLFSSPNVRKS